MSTNPLTDIEAFLSQTGMGTFRFGLLAASNGRLVERLRAGKTAKRGRPVFVSPETERRVRDFMAVERAKRQRVAA